MDINGVAAGIEPMLKRETIQVDAMIRMALR